MRTGTLITLSTLGPLLLNSCTVQEDRFKSSVVQAINEKPEILSEAISSHPKEFAGAFQTALKRVKEKRQLHLEQRKKAKLREAIAIQYQPAQRDDELIQGDKRAPITLVLYNNFETRSAKRAFETARELLKKYKGEIKFIYKHLPMEMHANAMISAKYYEALRLQSDELALDFQEQLYENQEKLRRGGPYLRKLALDLGADEKSLMRDLNGQQVTTRIEQDIDEAYQFGLRSSPSFILNGIPITGAYPQERFQELMTQL